VLMPDINAMETKWFEIGTSRAGGPPSTEMDIIKWPSVDAEGLVRILHELVNEKRYRYKVISSR
jgi:hypothetical protein